MLGPRGTQTVDVEAASAYDVVKRNYGNDIPGFVGDFNGDDNQASPEVSLPQFPALPPPLRSVSLQDFEIQRRPGGLPSYGKNPPNLRGGLTLQRKRQPTVRARGCSVPLNVTVPASVLYVSERLGSALNSDLGVI